MIDDNITIEKDSDRDELREVIITKFRGLAKQYFQLDVHKEIDYLNLIKESARFYSFGLPDELSEMLIRYEEAPLFWIFRSPIITYLEDFLKTSNSQSGGQNLYKIIKDFYTKWLINKQDDEKKYFAMSAVNFIEKKSSKSNFLHLIFEATILGYDKHLINTSRAIELLEKSKELINGQNLNEDVRDELRYILLIYQGFFLLRAYDNESASRYFAEALTVKPFGITAKFYSSLNSVIVNDGILPAEALMDFYSYDKSRIEFAIDKNDLSMMSYFINYAVINKLFYQHELAQSFTVFSDFLRDVKNSVEYDLNKLKASLTNFKNLNVNEYYDDKVVNNITFIEKLFQSYFKDENVFFTGVSGKLFQKFKQTLDIIINAIKQKYYNEVKAKLQIFENELQYKITDLQLLTKEHEDQKNKYKERLSNTIKGIEKKAAESIAYIEERIENLQIEQGYDPKQTFKNAMTYNIILSFTVFLMGGCAEYSNTFMNDVNRYNQFFSLVVVAGFKWGIIAFTVGLIISIVAAGLAILEAANQKQKLLQTINRLKDDKDYQIEFYKKEFERKGKESDERFNKNIEEKKKYIDGLKADKDLQEKKFKEEAEKQIQVEAKPILELIQE